MYLFFSYILGKIYHDEQFIQLFLSFKKFFLNTK